MVNLHSFKSYLIEKNPKHLESVLKYEDIYGELPVSFEDSAIYKEYLSRFNYEVQYRHPVDESNKFDWKIFLQLVVASDSTNYSLVVNENRTVDLIVFIEIDNGKIPKNVNEISMNTINRFFTIFLNEQINRFVIMKESEFWKVALKSTQDKRVELFMDKIVPQLKQDILSYEIMKKFRQNS